MLSGTTKPPARAYEVASSDGAAFDGTGPQPASFILDSTPMARHQSSMNARTTFEAQSAN